MNRIIFLIFVAVVIMAASAGLLLDYKKMVIMCTLVGFVIGIAIAISMMTSLSSRNEPYGTGQAIGFSFGIGVCLAIIVVWLLQTAMGAAFILIGSTLGGVIGCMYKE